MPRDELVLHHDLLDIRVPIADFARYHLALISENELCASPGGNTLREGQTSYETEEVLRLS